MKSASILMGAVLLAAVIGSNPRAQAPAGPRIPAVENGLLPFQSGPQQEGAAPQKAETLAERMAEYKIPGVSVVVIEGGRIAWAKGYGTRRVDQSAPVTNDTLFEAASTTKMLTAVSALHFVEAGRIDLDRDVNAYLKSWKIPDSDLTRDHRVTLRLLLTHQSGLNGPKGGFSWEDGKVPTLVQAYQGNSRRVISQSTARLMLKKELDLDPEILGFPVGEGLGVLLTGAGQDLSFLHPGDNAPGASCWLVGFPTRGQGAVIMTNGAKGNLLAMELLASIGKEYGWPKT